MSDNDAPEFTETECEALNRLFDAIQQVAGGNDEFRLVDPAGKVAPLFLREEQASAFVGRLCRHGLVTLAFKRTVGGEEVETYSAAYARWPDFAAIVRRVPDPPLSAEERGLIRIVGEKRERRAALVAEREALLGRLAEIERSIAAAGQDLEEAEKLIVELSGLQTRIARVLNGGAGART